MKNRKNYMKEILEHTKEYNSEDRRRLILELLRQQRHAGVKSDIAREFCTLIDLTNGILIGNGECPKCHSFMGRQDDYVEL